MHSLHSSSMPSRLLSKCSNPGMVFMSVSNARRCPDVKFMKLLLSVFGHKKRAPKDSNVLGFSFATLYFVAKRLKSPNVVFLLLTFFR